MKTIKRTMHFPKFNEKVNDFYYEKHTYERPMTEKEHNLQIRYKLLIALFTVYAITLPIGLILALATEVNLWDLILIPIVLVWSWLFAKMLNTLLKWEDQIISFNDYGFEAEEFLYNQISQEENDKAAKWRAEHPLEEAVRKAQETKNCNDIAALLKLYQNGDLKL